MRGSIYHKMFKLSLSFFEVIATETFHELDHSGWSLPSFMQRFPSLDEAVVAFNTVIADPKTFMAQISCSTHFRRTVDPRGLEESRESISGVLQYITLAKWRRDRSAGVEAYSSPSYFFNTLENWPGIVDHLVSDEKKEPIIPYRTFKRCVDQCEDEFSRKRRLPENSDE